MRKDDMCAHILLQLSQLLSFMLLPASHADVRRLRSSQECSANSFIELSIGNAMSQSTIPTITASERSPDGGKGLARDMRVRWALEEAGQAYEVRLVSFVAMKQVAHRALHSFG